MNEIWKDIKGYEYRYKISNHGRVKSLNRAVPRGNSFFVVKERIRKIPISNNGYKSLFLRNGEEYKGFTLHRLLAIHFIDNPLSKPCVNHIDGNKLNNKLSNLEWCTHSENNFHAVKNGLNISIKGELHPRAKLNNIQVRIIKKLITDEFPNKLICEYFSIQLQHLYSIKYGRSWSHI